MKVTIVQIYDDNKSLETYFKGNSLKAPIFNAVPKAKQKVAEITNR